MKILALVLWPIFFIIASSLYKRSSLDPRYKSFSVLGASYPIGKYFNSLLISTGALQLIFLLFVYARLTNNDLKPVLYLFLSSTILGIMAGIINLKINTVAHYIVSFFGFLLGCAGYIIFAYQMSEVAFTCSTTLILFSLVTLAGVVYFFIKINDIPAYIEYCFFLNAFLSNLLIVFYLI